MANITGWLGDQNSKLIRKKLQELKAKLTKSPDSALIKLNATRNKGILPDGRQVNVVFSGSPGPFEVGQKIDDTHYFVRGQEFKHTGIDGGAKYYVIVRNTTVVDPNFQYFIRTQNTGTLYRLPFEDVPEYPLGVFPGGYTDPDLIERYVTITEDGKNIVLVKIQPRYAGGQEAYECADSPCTETLPCVLTYQQDVINAHYSILALKNFTLNSQTLLVASNNQVSRELEIDATQFPSATFQVPTPIACSPDPPYHIEADILWTTHRCSNALGSIGPEPRDIVNSYKSEGDTFLGINTPHLSYTNYNRYCIFTSPPDTTYTCDLNTGTSFSTAGAWVSHIVHISYNIDEDSYELSYTDLEDYFNSASLPFYLLSRTTNRYTGVFTYLFNTTSILRLVKTTGFSPYPMTSFLSIDTDIQSFIKENRGLLDPIDAYVCNRDQMFQIYIDNDFNLTTGAGSVYGVRFINDDNCLTAEVGEPTPLQSFNIELLDPVTDKFAITATKTINSPGTILPLTNGFYAAVFKRQA